MTLNELIPVLQVAIGPVILISGVGLLLLLTMTNRLARTIDRARQLSISATMATTAHASGAILGLRFSGGGPDCRRPPSCWQPAARCSHAG